MATSQNGWKANDRSLIKTYTVPGTTVQLPIRKGNAATVLLYVADRYNREVEKLHPGWCWGYAERNIRGSSTTLSNHASGTAIDLNAPAHPRGTAPSANYSRKQIRAIHAIVKACDGAIRWGGDYVSAPKDGMHFEINTDATHVAALAARISAATAPGSQGDDEVPDRIHAWSDDVELVAGTKQSIRLTHESYDTGDHHAPTGYSIVTGPADVVGRVAVTVTGLPAGKAVQARLIETNPKKGYAIHKPGGHPINTVMGSGRGTDYGMLAVSEHIDSGMHCWVQLVSPPDLPAGCKAQVDADVKYWR